ncbi:HlyD family secretion protein [Anatilimnocola sp. NA78]|uniref:HlyD family secretion protein n=1 Tax=Anatilimnocola sp. NA78 TaxID=3415683 RepID=UPI003CE5C3C9
MTTKRTAKLTMVTKAFLAGTVLLALGGTTAGLWYQFFPHQNELKLPGTVESQEVRLSSRVGGRVIKTFVDDGDVLEAGAKVVELEMPELDSQHAQLQAQLAAAEAILTRLEKGPRKEEIAASQAAKEAAEARLARMKKGFRQEETEQVNADLEAAKAELENARTDMIREKGLLDKAATSRGTYDAAVARYGRLHGQVNSLAAKLRMYESGYREEEIAESVAELARLQANLDLLHAGTRVEEIDEAKATVQNLRAKIDELDVMRRERIVYAPEKCVVQTLAVRPGDIAAPNRPIALVLRADDLWVKAYVSEVDLGRIKVGQKVAVTIDTFPDKRFEGEVIYIAPESEFTPRNVQTIDERRHQVFAVKVRVADPQGVFKSGMAADVWLAK